jgi:hypothetical protein
VSTDFGDRYAAVVQAMRDATHDWQNASHVRFVHRGDQDGRCNPDNPNVLFDVHPASGLTNPARPNEVVYAESFSPRDIRSERNIRIDSSAFGSTGAWTLAGILRHELGHSLGFGHEHTRPEANKCLERATGWTALTPYDSASVMHYPSCNGTNQGRDLILTASDRAGAARLYGIDFLNSEADADGEADLDGDGRADFCGRGTDGIVCALSSGATFGPVGLWSKGFADSGGWNLGPERYATIRFPDLDGDHKADVCGRSPDGIFCALSGASEFGSVRLWSNEFTDSGGWNFGPEYYATIRFPDLNGDGRADICGRGWGGLLCALSDGSSFGPVTLWSSGFGDPGGWNSGSEYSSTIRFADLNGDGKADVCGRGAAGISCSLSNGATFGPVSLWSKDFNDAGGWGLEPGYYATIRFADLNRDGKADVCGRGAAGLICALSNGAAFRPASLWSNGFDDASGWGLGPEYYATIRFPDLNGDGRADVCGRGAAGLTCALSNGSVFEPAGLWSNGFSDSGGWGSGPEYFATIRFSDLNGDGKADVCGRGASGLECALATGSTFAPVTLWSNHYGDPGSWDSALEYSTTIRFPDLNGDGKADVCGRGSSGILCGLTTDAGILSDSPDDSGPEWRVGLWSKDFSDLGGWNSSPSYYATIDYPDLDGDGRADICGRGAAGLTCALSKGSGFAPVSLWSGGFSDPGGWGLGPEYYATIRYPDLNGDGKADVCGRGAAGLNCALSTGSTFGPVSLWSNDFSDAGGWGLGPEYSGTIRYPDLNGDGKADVCGRGAAGLICALSDGSSFGPASRWSSDFNDAGGWGLGAEYFGTIRFSDLNGDGRADVCGRGAAGLICALSNGSAFGLVRRWSSEFSDSGGWGLGPEYYATIRFSDLDSDGKADVCGRGVAGLICALSNGSAFGAVSRWSSEFEDARAGTWPETFSTIQFPDLNDDGRADVCGRTSSGISCSLASESAPGFRRTKLWSDSTGPNGWNSGPQYFGTVRMIP